MAGMKVRNWTIPKAYILCKQHTTMIINLL